MPTPEQRFAYWLRQLRQERGLSQVALAEMVGLDPTALTKIEKGNRSIRLNEAEALANALNQTVSTMLTGKPSTHHELLHAQVATRLSE
jgi:transcriptional regulator with XRE-family HTH domain